MEPEVFGPYRLEVLIGRGGMGEVFRAYDTRRNRTVAVKRLPRHLALDEEYRVRFQRESASVAQLREPHVIPIHDYGEIDGQLFIDMRLVEGDDLATMLLRGPLTVTRAVDVVSQMADALDAAHAEGLVHRDVKPSNILLVSGVTGATNRGVAYLVDFGIARALGGPTLSQAGLPMGSIGYMAPERFTGDEWDHRVDVYALACVLYQCLVGVRPFAAASLPAAIYAHMHTPPPRPSQSRPELPAGFDELIAIGMAKKPTDRYASAGGLAFAARSLLTAPSRAQSWTPPAPGTPIAADPAPQPATGPGPRPDPVQPTGRGVSRRRTLQVLGGAGALAAGGAAVWGGLRAAGLVGAAGPWTFTTGDKVYSSPTVADGVVYVGSNDGSLYALAAATGEARWRYRAEASITSSPAVAAGVVYVGCNDQRLHAVDAATGQARWTAPTGAVTHSSPTVVESTVYIGSRDSSLRAFDALTGAPRWRFAAGDWFNSSPTVVDGTVYVGCRDRNIYAVTAATGVERWRFTTDSSVDSSPVVVGGVLHIGCDDSRVLALDAADGVRRWEFTAGKGVVSSPAVQGGIVYVGSDDTVLYALESDTGRLRWSYRTGGGIRSSPAVVDGVVYVGSQDRFLHAVDALTGAPRWRFETKGPVDDSSPAVANGLVYVGSLDHSVYAVDARTGAGRAT